MNNIARWTLAPLVVLLLASSLLATGSGVKLMVHAFRVPKEQTWEIFAPGGGAPEVSILCRGNGTANFPGGVIMLRSELASDADDCATFEFVRERVTFGSEGYATHAVRVEDIGRWAPELTTQNPVARNRFEKRKSEDSSEEFEVTAELGPSLGKDIILKLKFESGRQFRSGSLSGGLSSTPYADTIVIPEERSAKLTLIGFPSFPMSPDKGTIYWLAVSAVRMDRGEEVPAKAR